MIIRNLFIFSGVAFVVSLACIGGAASLVSHDLDKHGWNVSVVKYGDHFSLLKGSAAKPAVKITKNLTWTGGDLLAIDAPADVVFTQGPTASVTVTGPEDLVNAVKLEAGRLSLIDNPDRKETINFITIRRDGIEAQSGHDGLRITITAPNVKRFELAGSGDLTVHGYDQPSLDLSIAGSGDVHVIGRTDKVKANLSGSGDADLSGLQAKDADVSTSGSGDVNLNATGKADVSTSGSGDITLSRKPAHLAYHTSGSGSINGADEEDNGETAAHSE